MSENDYNKKINITTSIDHLDLGINANIQQQALNLSPSPVLGQFYLVPFKNKKKGTFL